MCRDAFHSPPAPPPSANWEDLRAVAEVVRRGTLSAAGEALAVNYSTVARRVARAEAALGAILFERLADGYSPTEEAHLVALHVARMADEEHHLMRRLSGRDGLLTGRLTVTAPQLLIAYAIAPALAEFRAAHPGLDLHVRATNDKLDLNRREADIGIRLSPDPGDTLTGLRLVEQETASFATQSWADRIAGDPARPIDWIIYEGHKGLPQGVADAWPGSRVGYRFDDMVAIAGAVQAGLGVARLPMFLGRTLPGVVRVPLLAASPYQPIWMVAHPDVWKGAKVTAFRKVMSRYLRAERARFVA